MSDYTPLEWARVLGTPAVHGSIRNTLEDFCVDEIPLLLPSGEGAHLWLQVEKRGANTEWTARQLATASACAVRDVGFAGMKDRSAVTTQWFSVPCPLKKKLEWRSWEIPDTRIIQARRHDRKLKRGVLGGNDFRIVIRQLKGDIRSLEPRLAAISESGVPNYFGPQRFGHNGLNVERGARWLLHQGSRQGSRLPRHKRGIYISAVRSFLYNQVLSARVNDGSWNVILDGESVNLDGSRSVFTCTLPDDELLRRCMEFDIHPTGPLPGNGDSGPERVAQALERKALDTFPELEEGLSNAGAKAARRSLRLVVKELEWSLDGEAIELKFKLPPGGYATSVLRELVSSD